ncbi:spirocyclase AveC family protein [Streptomyces sp. KLMMK]|uniref:spirocyclase AveC family protein n=1 Tax=Streptomyces sp. KLMMK TaxID=3109353 RepID=UPI00300A03BA
MLSRWVADDGYEFTPPHHALPGPATASIIIIIVFGGLFVVGTAVIVHRARTLRRMTPELYMILCLLSVLWIEQANAYGGPVNEHNPHGGPVTISSWGPYIPGWAGEEPQHVPLNLITWLLAWIGGVMFLLFAGHLLVRYRTQHPGMTKRAVALTLVGMTTLLAVLEDPVFAFTPAFRWYRGIEGFTLFPGTSHQFPLHETICFTLLNLGAVGFYYWLRAVEPRFVDPPPDRGPPLDTPRRPLLRRRRRDRHHDRGVRRAHRRHRRTAQRHTSGALRALACPMSRTPGQVVVLGASIAGLLAAAAAARTTDSVIIIDRDTLPALPAHRRGTPQATHAHGMLAAGIRAIEQLLPGFLDTVASRGASIGDSAADVVINTPFGPGRRISSDFIGVGASRPLIEWAIRALVTELPAVTLLPGHTCTGLIGDPHRVSAIRVSDGGAEQPLDADLVVDATGRGTRIDHWLTDLGCAPVPGRTLNAHVGYASRTYRLPHDPGWMAYYLQLAPHHPTGAVVTRVEDQQTIVSLIGVGPALPRLCEDTFAAFTRDLRCPDIADSLAGAEPLTSITAGNSTSSRRRYPERARDHPANLLCVGDALCSPNPIYAHGISLAAIAASHLDRLLTREPGHPNLARRFHHGLAQPINWAWLAVTTADLRWPDVEGGPPPRLHRLLACYIDHVLATGTRDSHIQRSLLDVLHLLRPPASLLAPATLARTLPSLLIKR